MNIWIPRGIPKELRIFYLIGLLHPEDEHELTSMFFNQNTPRWEYVEERGGQMDSEFCKSKELLCGCVEDLISMGREKSKNPLLRFSRKRVMKIRKRYKRHLHLDKISSQRFALMN